METKREWPDGFWDRFEAPAKDFEIPEPLPDAPHRDRVIDEWITASALDADSVEESSPDQPGQGHRDLS